MNSDSNKSALECVAALRFPESATSGTHDAALPARIAEGKAAAVLAVDEMQAAVYWQAKMILAIQLGYLEAFRKLKAGEFYAAWCELERCEIQLDLLIKNFPPLESDEHRLQLIGRMILRWQELFPYRVFFSPEILKKKIVCSICKGRITPRGNCGHVKGWIYQGDSCHHIIEDAEILSISIVENPVQRYSVVFFSGPDGTQVDHYNYGNVKFVADRATSAFHEWFAEMGKRTIAASLAANLALEAPCPCLSSKAFGACCKNSPTITVPHLQISFIGDEPDSTLPKDELMLNG